MTPKSGVIDIVNTLRPRQDGCRLPGDIFKCIFFNENALILIKISLKFVTKVRINNIPALVQIMAWRRPGDKPLSGPVMVSLLTHICVTRPQWVNNSERFARSLRPNTSETFSWFARGLICILEGYCRPFHQPLGCLFQTLSKPTKKPSDLCFTDPLRWESKVTERLRKRWRATACCGKSKFAISSGWLKKGSVSHPDDIITLP